MQILLFEKKRLYFSKKQGQRAKHPQEEKHPLKEINRAGMPNNHSSLSISMYFNMFSNKPFKGPFITLTRTPPFIRLSTIASFNLKSPLIFEFREAAKVYKGDFGRYFDFFQYLVIHFGSFRFILPCHHYDQLGHRTLDRLFIYLLQSSLSQYKYI